MFGYRPSLILLVGIPGSGKTTYAEKYLEVYNDAIHLSSDKIRAELWGDEATQGDNNEVFSLMQSRTIEALNNGLSVLYDATNVTRKDRSYIISLCPKFVKIECHIVWAPIETCIERDAARERTVGKAVIDKMLKRFQAPYYDEGIDEIKLFWNTKEDFNQHVYVDNLMRAADIDHDNPHHTLNIKEHCEEAYKYALAHRYPSNLSFAVHYHDIGKPYVKAFIDNKGNPCDTAHYYQHNCVGAWMAYGFSLYSVEFAWLVSVHMDPFLNTKYYNKLPAFLKEQVDLIHEADLNAH
jgi:predicted kinase